MKQLWNALFPHRDERPLADQVNAANSALEQARRDAAEARRDHADASKRITRAMEDSVKIAQDALREKDH